MYRRECTAYSLKELKIFSFFETTDLLTDSKKTLKKKANRRKSNYYEGKREELKSNLQYINNSLYEIDANYNLLAMRIESDADDVMDCAYHKAITDMLKKTETAVKDLKSKRDVAQARHTRISVLQIYFQQRG